MKIRKQSTQNLPKSMVTDIKSKPKIIRVISKPRPKKERVDRNLNLNFSTSSSIDLLKACMSPKNSTALEFDIPLITIDETIILDKTNEMSSVMIIPFSRNTTYYKHSITRQEKNILRNTFLSVSNHSMITRSKNYMKVENLMVVDSNCEMDNTLTNVLIPKNSISKKKANNVDILESHPSQKDNHHINLIDKGVGQSRWQSRFDPIFGQPQRKLDNIVDEMIQSDLNAYLDNPLIVNKSYGKKKSHPAKKIKHPSEELLTHIKKNRKHRRSTLRCEPVTETQLRIENTMPEMILPSLNPVLNKALVKHIPNAIESQTFKKVSQPDEKQIAHINKDGKRKRRKLLFEHLSEPLIEVNHTPIAIKSQTFRKVSQPYEKQIAHINKEGKKKRRKLRLDSPDTLLEKNHTPNAIKSQTFEKVSQPDEKQIALINKEGKKKRRKLRLESPPEPLVEVNQTPKAIKSQTFIKVSQPDEIQIAHINKEGNKKRRKLPLESPPEPLIEVNHAPNAIKSQTFRKVSQPDDKPIAHINKEGKKKRRKLRLEPLPEPLIEVNHTPNAIKSQTFGKVSKPDEKQIALTNKDGKKSISELSLEPPSVPLIKVNHTLSAINSQIIEKFSQPSEKQFPHIKKDGKQNSKLSLEPLVTVPQIKVNPTANLMKSQPAKKLGQFSEKQLPNISKEQCESKLRLESIAAEPQGNPTAYLMKSQPAKKLGQFSEKQSPNISKEQCESKLRLESIAAEPQVKVNHTANLMKSQPAKKLGQFSEKQLPNISKEQCESKLRLESIAAEPHIKVNYTGDVLQSQPVIKMNQPSKKYLPHINKDGKQVKEPLLKVKVQKDLVTLKTTDNYLSNVKIEDPPPMDVKVTMPTREKDQLNNHCNIVSSLLTKPISKVVISPITINKIAVVKPLIEKVNVLVTKPSNFVKPNPHGMAISNKVAMIGEAKNEVTKPKIISLVKTRISETLLPMDKLLYIVLDTNILLLDVWKSLMKYLEETKLKHNKENIQFLIPWTVLNELEGIKGNVLLQNKSHDTVTRARNVLSTTYSALQSHCPYIIGQSAKDNFQISKIFERSNNDDSILQCCLQIKEKGDDVMLLTNDNGLGIKAYMNSIPAYTLKSISKESKLDLCNIQKFRNGTFVQVLRAFRSLISYKPGTPPPPNTSQTVDPKSAPERIEAIVKRFRYDRSEIDGGSGCKTAPTNAKTASALNTNPHSQVVPKTTKYEAGYPIQYAFPRHVPRRSSEFAFLKKRVSDSNKTVGTLKEIPLQDNFYVKAKRNYYLSITSPKNRKSSPFFIQSQNLIHSNKGTFYQNSPTYTDYTNMYNNNPHVFAKYNNYNPGCHVTTAHGMVHQVPESHNAPPIPSGFIPPIQKRQNGGIQHSNRAISGLNVALGFDMYRQQCQLSQQSYANDQYEWR